MIEIPEVRYVRSGDVPIADHVVGDGPIDIGYLTEFWATGEVPASSTVRDPVAGSGPIFEDRWLRELKGVPQARRPFAVADEREDRACC